MNDKLRIAIVISHPIQHFCPQYVCFTENKDVEFKVFFGSSLGHKNYIDANFKKEIAWGNLNLEKFDHLFLNGDAIIQPDKNLDAPSLEKELNMYKPGIVFCYGYYQKLQRRVYKWAIKNNVLIAYISDSELRHPENFLKKVLKSIYLKKRFSKIDYFLSMGNANEDFYYAYGVKKKKIIRMHYPIDFVHYQKCYLQKDLLRSKIRKEYNIGQDEFVISVVGKLVPWKNQDHIIDAMKLLEKEGIFLHLFILGSGEMMDTWKEKSKALKQSKVYFPGFINIEELPSFYAAADTYAHPASLEPHSVAISEAIMMGCPIIISSTCGSYGADDDVQEEKNGFVYQFGDIPELAKKIKFLIRNPEKRNAFGAYSHKIAMAFQNNSHYIMLAKLASRIKANQSN